MWDTLKAVGLLVLALVERVWLTPKTQALKNAEDTLGDIAKAKLQRQQRKADRAKEASASSTPSSTQ